MARIGIVNGSTRQASFNRILSVAATEILQELGAEVMEIDFSALPFMDEDIEFPVLPEVASVRQQVQDVDALWFFTPQYNDAMPGYVKNFLDWMSRRDSPEAPREDAALVGKPVTVAGISGPAATAAAREQLSHVAAYIGARVMTEHQAGLVLPGSAWSTGEYTPSEEHLAALRTQAEAFLAFISTEG